MRILLALMGFCLSLHAGEPDPYYGKNSWEATLKFDHRVAFYSDGQPSTHKAQREIEAQVRHLFGPLGVSKRRAVPKNDAQITDVRLEREGEEGRWIARYKYRGKVLIEGPVSGEFEITLPVAPDEVYDSGVVVRDGITLYPCTDTHYHGRSDFWYFWNPQQSECPLREGVDYERVKARVDVFFDTQTSYPEYSRLRGPDDTIRIDVLVGMDDPRKSHDPMASRDLNAPTYRQIRASLIELGYVARRWSEDEVAAIVGDSAETAPSIEELARTTERARVVVRMFFGATGMDEESRAFHYFYKDALENASVMIYDGHSGLSDYLDLPAMEGREGFTIAPNQSRYQIYFFNSCSSYPYYNNIYFARKRNGVDPKGTKNLDIITNGLTTAFFVPHETNMILIRAIDAWADAKETQSYQKIIDAIDSGNLAGVNGDEDNPEDPGQV